MGRKSAGRESKKVTKTKIALTTPAGYIVSWCSLIYKIIVSSIRSELDIKSRDVACLVKKNRTCQGTLAEQQILGDIVHGRRGSHGLLRNEGEAQQQASAGGEEKVHAHKGHHQLGRHLGGIVRIRQRERGLAKESKMNGR